MAQQPSLLLRAALVYARLGWRVLPLHTQNSSGACTCKLGIKCPRLAKHPRIREWETRATTDPATINEWWDRWPTANVGIATGLESGIIVVDIDGNSGQLHATMDRLPETRISRTGSGGYHLVFASPGQPVVCAVGLQDGVDIRGDGGYIVAPPSIHKSGKPYKWEDWRTPIASLPRAFFRAKQEAPQEAPAPPRKPLSPDRPEASPRYAQMALASECSTLAGMPEKSGRNHRLNRAAFKMARFILAGSITETEVKSALLEAAARAGLDEAESIPTVESGLRGGQRKFAAM